MHLKILKATLLCASFSILSLPALSMDDGEGGDLSSLISSGQQQKQPPLSALLMSQVDTDPMREGTEKLKPIFSKTEIKQELIYEKSRFSVSFLYDPAAKIDPLYPVLEVTEQADGLWADVNDRLEQLILAGTEYAPELRKKANEIALRKKSNFSRLVGSKGILSFLSSHPEVLGESSLDEYIKNNLQGAFHVDDSIASQEEAAQKELTKRLLGSTGTLSIHYAFPRTDGILNDAAAKKSIAIDASFWKYIDKTNSKGVVTISLTCEALADEVSPDILTSNRIASDSILSDVLTDFDAFVRIQLMNIIISANQKFGVVKGSSLYG